MLMEVGELHSLRVLVNPVAQRGPALWECNSASVFLDLQSLC